MYHHRAATHTPILLLLVGFVSITGCNSTVDFPEDAQPVGEVKSEEFNPEKPLGEYANYRPSPLSKFGGGKTTNRGTRLRSDAFSDPATGISSTLNRQFQTGNSLFRDVWNLPSNSTNLRDGLGPFYNERACASCHTLDGRGKIFPPIEEKDTYNNTLLWCGDLGAMLLRISIPYADPKHPGMELSQPDPIYGDQLEPKASPLMPGGGEATQCIYFKEMTENDFDGEYVVTYKDTGKRIALTTVVPRIYDWNYGDPLLRTNTVYISPRIAPQMIGMGLLEAIPEEELVKKDDPDDRDGDGVSGRMVRIPEFFDGKKKLYNLPGRFGWKAEQPTVAGQTAGAFLGDMGITSPLHPDNNCPNRYFSPLLYQECYDASLQEFTLANEGTEIDERNFDFIAKYSSLLSVPKRRSFGARDVLRGNRLFLSIGCDKCHTPHFKTAPSNSTPITTLLPVLGDQDIFPYTDLLVHDMGPGLCDNRPPFYPGAADGCEWRTSPLWGVGLIEGVNGHQRLLHDGRANGVEEAILWHGGEAKPQKERFLQLKESDRKALISFVNDL